MGLSSTDGAQLCVFDLRRGQQEGQELDKILFFHPTDCPILLQLSVIGLCEGIITFTRIFSPEDDCEVIESDRHSHVFYQAETDIWMVLVVEKTKDSESTLRCAALQGILKESHSLFTMFHGPIRSLLDRKPSAELARGHLHTFITDYLSDFTVGKKLQLPTYRDSLKERGTVQMLTVSREVALEVQSLATVLGSCLGNVACQSIVLFEDLLVSTTLSPDDTLNLYTYAILRLTPRALSNANSWSYLRKGVYVNAGSTSSSSNGAATAERYHSRSRDTSPDGQNQMRHNFRPLQREKLSKGKDGFVAAEFATTEVRGAVPLTPILWFQQAEERMYLCVYQHKSLTILLLIPASSLINGEEGIAHVKRHLLENASENIVMVEQKLARGWGGENAYHVGGYRYLLVDPDRKISRASPPGKVTTLSKDSLLALNRLREEMDLEKSRAKRSDPTRDKDFEVCIRAKNNAWVIAKITRGRELYMALEKGGETLLYASTAVEKFSNRYCEGAFSTD
ncbi:vacuolar fusion protein CCZ1 homolog isoform X1 [Brachypodium distachyon]|uniref:vacuolar fusion protein CCZ1 homolog isoform X1 n=1 Tax=Brachypodium distachyon TaxID=15368 RepID=UPI0001C7474C|nr:vacuolar fusion protein CCZ1 homolog isoform X1 [Brachypodium distachyon]XP_024317633.1 vacuolar fusion protein CCZ1 homolog isoform X1 [Brachypodium distachyon]|eukprot:XP_010235140.1 vacuolar fusion protein CCZ1 homolog isoform X1 [Brachypodium distachyon]